jgi:hypothetical protein
MSPRPLPRPCPRPPPRRDIMYLLGANRRPYWSLHRRLQCRVNGFKSPFTPRKPCAPTRAFNCVDKNGLPHRAGCCSAPPARNRSDPDDARRPSVRRGEPRRAVPAAGSRIGGSPEGLSQVAPAPRPVPGNGGNDIHRSASARLLFPGVESFPGGFRRAGPGDRVAPGCEFTRPARRSGRASLSQRSSPAASATPTAASSTVGPRQPVQGL